MTSRVVASGTRDSLRFPVRTQRPQAISHDLELDHLQCLREVIDRSHYEPSPRGKVKQAFACRPGSTLYAEARQSGGAVTHGMHLCYAASVRGMTGVRPHAEPWRGCANAHAPAFLGATPASFSATSGNDPSYGARIRCHRPRTLLRRPRRSRQAVRCPATYPPRSGRTGLFGYS